MTGVHAEESHGHRSPEANRRAHVWRIGTPVVVLLSGALFVTSAVDSEGTDLRPGRYTDLAGVVEADAASYRSLEDRRQALTDEVEALTNDIADAGVARAQGKVAELKDSAGLEPRQGPGVSVTLSDAPEDVLAAAIDAGTDLNLNRLVVHQQDIQAVVNALWLGGASAVTIAGQRVVSTTGIKCEGNAVQLQGVPYPQPYVIEAVGDPVDLVTSIASDPLVSGYRADAADPTIAVGWAMDVEDEVVAPAFTGVHEMRYAVPLR
ncbi:DUF881 domain-containing protein [Nocardioides sp. GY 10113]|uniref:DUF881 domain-containing protein n=1 Tax=Nocardioides sp. GY 10113 TaxID=2569761 RepID=UPI0010A83BBF|nr:DUF881 domain-containing protein [Nocardioides sp. GY 10113]TIC89091.1 DUF881 domain-containing protein [Nocardioides sp. GY 10113]